MPPGTDDRKKDAVYRTILEQFLSGQYRFGHSVPVKAISETIGVSRQPVMAALNRLSMEGFVTITAQVGCQVVAPSAVEISDFFLLFSRYEGLMAELAARRRTDRELRAMYLANEAITSIAPQEPDPERGYRALNRVFHGAVHAGSHSQTVIDRAQSAWTMSDFLIAQSYGFTPPLHDAAAEHAAIITAIEEQDAVQARAAAERHITKVAELVAQSLGRNTTA